MGRSGRFLLCLSALLAMSIGADAFAQTPKIALHAKASVFGSSNTCPDGPAPVDPNTAGIPCSGYTTQSPGYSATDVYLVVAQAGTAGVSNVRCGIQYDGNVFASSWSLCADLEFPSAGTGGAWPSSGSGNSVLWGTCSDTEIGSEGVHAVVGAFYIYAYDGGLLEVTADETVVPSQLFVTECFSSQTNLTLDDLGAVGFGIPGVNPCAPDPLEINDIAPSCPLASGGIGTPITPVTFTATGGTPPYAWSQTGLPAGVDIDSLSGDVTGTPTVDGVFNFTITVTDVDTNTDTLDCSITVLVPPLVIDTVTPSCPLPDGELGLNYGPVAFTATGGKPPYTWGAAGGVPDGLGMNPDTGELAGPLLELGTFLFTITVRDSGNVRFATRNCSLTVVDAGQPPTFQTPFATEMVEVAERIGSFKVSIDTDSRGQPHILYLRQNTGNWWYATRRNGVWSPEFVANPFQRAGDLELDATDRPHAAYNEQYAQRQDDGTWLEETFHPTSVSNLSLSLDSQGQPHIAFLSDSKLWYTMRTAPDTWISEVVDSLGHSFSNPPSLVVDVWGEPHITYPDAAPQEGLFYARKRNGVWTIEGIDLGTDERSASSLRIDDRGDPHVAYEGPGNDLRYAVRRDDRWYFEPIDDLGGGPSLDLDANGTPHIAYTDYLSPQNKRYAVRTGTGWSIEVLDQQENVGFGQGIDLSLDSQDNPHVVYVGAGPSTYGFGIIYKHARVFLESPSGGEVWPVGALRTLNWSGVGPVDVFLSSDGGNSFQWLETVTESPAGFRVPHQPSRFCVMRIERAVPFASALSESLFTIEASVALLNLSAQSIDGGGVLLSWETDPGPEDLAGYMIERSPAGSKTWSVLASGVRETSYLDAFGGPGMNYRLTAVNGMGQELVLGETALTPLAALSAWPMPYRGGELTLSFATFSGLGGGSGLAEVAIYDLNGRLVRTVARGDYEAGYQTATWDGRDESGREVSSGLYFVRAMSAGKDAQMKLVVLR